tara:strand:+ start:695 stop:886 length:192 start_codon:yes stop_codon:yes gene_type:complete
VSHITNSWIEQLKRYEKLVASFDGQVEIRLYANKGSVRKRPMIVLNGGSQPIENSVNTVNAEE